MNPNSKLTALERTIMLQALEILEGTEKRRTICGCVTVASDAHRDRIDDQQWGWPTSRGREAAMACVALRASIHQALNLNSEYANIYTIEEYIIRNSNAPDMTINELLRHPGWTARVRQTRIEFVKHILENW